MKNFWTTLYLFLIANLLFSQPNINWAYCYGGSLAERANCIKQTKDGGYIVAGISMSNDSDVSGHHGSNTSNDYWILKLNDRGAIEWQKSFGGSKNDVATYEQQTLDGGYIVAGYTTSFDGDIVGHHGTGLNDFWVIKLDSIGTLIWSKCYGGSGEDVAYNIEQLQDSSYVVTGFNNSFDGDVTAFHNFDEYWIVRLDKIGNIIWQKSLGGFQTDDARSLCITKNGFAIAGYSSSNDGDVSGNHGSYDYWIVAIDSLGNIIWQKSYGGTQYEMALCINSTIDNGYIVSGYTTSDDGDITTHYGEDDYWLLKLDSTGTIQWQKSFGGTKSEDALSVIQTNDNGYAVAGNTYSSDGDVVGHHGTYLFNDYWILKLDTLGNIQWQKTLGGIGYEEASSIIQTSDSGYIVAGFSGYSNDGDVFGNNGDLDYWIVKLAPIGLAVPELQNNIMDLQILQSNGNCTLRFFSKKNIPEEMEVYDISGKKIFENNISINEGINYQKFSNEKFQSGIYVVRLGETSKRFIVAN